MSFQLPALPYGYDALEPYIDKETMEIHHTRHHRAYVDNLNKALIEAGSSKEPLEKILKQVSSYAPAVRNNGGGHYNHSLFWTVLSPAPEKEPSGGLRELLFERWGTLDDFFQQFNQLALTRFGSGWAWLYLKYNGRLEVASTPNQDNPLMDVNLTDRGIPLLGLDLWEHAYYLNYQNKRAAYVEAFREVLDWKAVEANYEKALKTI